jgi:hypothetical protein
LGKIYSLTLLTTQNCLGLAHRSISLHWFPLGSSLLPIELKKRVTSSAGVLLFNSVTQSLHFRFIITTFQLAIVGGESSMLLCKLVI